MKVKVSFTLQVDEKKWANEYGLDVSDVRKDVQAYFEYGAYEQLQVLGLEQKRDV